MMSRIATRSPSFRCSILLLCAGYLLHPVAALAASPVEKLEEFPLDQVQITDEYQKALFAKEIAYLDATIDADRLLNGFKATAAGTNPTNLYGGWENSLIRGHTMGHWLSAMAHAYAQTKGNDATVNARLKTKLDHVISLLKTYQGSNGFLFATPVDQFGAPEGQNVSSWVPWYTMHKILAGLVDVAKYEESADALAIASKLGDWIYTRASGWDSGTRSRVLGTEYGGMNDALYELYKLTNKANHLTAAHIFDETNLFTTTAAGNDTLSGKHANTTIPKFIGALNRYVVLGTGEQSYFTAADQFLSIVLKNHTYVTGGNSEDEHFHASGKLDQYRDNVNNETCNVYNMSKLTRGLFMITGDIKYADYYERVHINEILASINPETGMTTYFKAMGTGYFKVFSSETNHFWCCTGTGMENFTRLNDSVYFHDAKDVWLTYYVSSTLNWKERGLAITQTTDLPLSNKVNLTISQAPLDAVNIRLRKPYWTSTCQIGVTVNGQSVAAQESGGFISISRVWQPNDKVELTFPLFVQTSRLQDNQNAVAFTYGPLVLSAGLGTASMTTASHGVQVLKATKPSGLQETIAVNSGTTINQWLADINKNLVQTPGKLEFNLKNTDSDGKLVFIPHYSRYKDRYGIYFKLSGTQGSAATTNIVCPPITGGSDGTGGTGGSGGATAAGGSGGATNSSGGKTGNANGGNSNMPTGGTNSGGATLGGSGSGASSSTSGGSATVGSGGANGGGSTGTTTAGSGGIASASGGTTGIAGGSSNGGATAPTGTKDSTSDSGCSCVVAGAGSRSNFNAVLLAGFGVGLVARRRRSRRA
jgi:MYXO-CTERM domain-containing protein